jgi:broad specificity phosphatase PhoE
VASSLTTTPEADMPAHRPEIWLVRHGATEWSESGRHTGRTDLPLTEAGRRRAEGLRGALADRSFALVLSSPLRRARDTAHLAGFPDAEIDEDLREWDYGDYEGITTVQIRERVPGWTIWRGPWPGGERPQQVAERARRVIARCDAAEGDALLFAHGHLLRVLTAVALALGPTEGACFALEVATINRLGHEHEYRTLRRWNGLP